MRTLTELSTSSRSALSLVTLTIATRQKSLFHQPGKGLRLTWGAMNLT